MEQSAKRWRLRNHEVAVYVIGGLFQICAVIYVYLHFDEAVPRLMPDDAFYYLKIAQNIANGWGSVFSVGEPTNGYHPLWMAMLAGMHVVLRPSPEQFVLCVLVLSVVLNLLAAVAFKRLLDRLGFPETASWFGVALYLCSPWLVNITLTGMETPVFHLALFSFLKEAHRAWRDEHAQTLRDGIRLGLTAGLLMLARTDAVFFTLPTFAVILVTRKLHAARQLAAAGLVAVLVLSPWLVWNYLSFGTIVQSSANAMSVLSRSYLPSVGSLRYWQASWTNFAATAYWAVMAPLFTHVTYGPKFEWGFTAVAIVTGVALAALFDRRFVVGNLRLPPMLWGPVLALLTYYFCVRHFAQIWHVSALFVLAIVWLLNYVPAAWSPARSITLVLCLLPFTIHSLGNGYFRPQSSMSLSAIRQYRSDSPKPLKLCTTDAGILAYFTRHTVVNLDGVVNNRALQYIMAGRFSEYTYMQGCDEVRVADDRLNYYDRNIVRPCRMRLTTGWYDRELDGAGWWMWSARAGEVRVQVENDGAWLLRTELSSIVQPNVIDVVINRQPYSSIDVGWSGFKPVEVRGLPLRAGTNVIELVSRRDGVTIPTDTRRLGIAVKGLSLTAGQAQCDLTF
jgi:hypothetical protein